MAGDAAEWRSPPTSRPTQPKLDWTQPRQPARNLDDKSRSPGRTLHVTQPPPRLPPTHHWTRPTPTQDAMDCTQPRPQASQVLQVTAPAGSRSTKTKTPRATNTTPWEVPATTHASSMSQPASVVNLRADILAAASSQCTNKQSTAYAINGKAANGYKR